VPKRNPWIIDPPSEPSSHRRADGGKTVLIQVWVPLTLRGQLHELAAELSQQTAQHVTMSDVVRRACRAFIREKLKGVK